MKGTKEKKKSDIHEIGGPVVDVFGVLNHILYDEISDVAKQIDFQIPDQIFSQVCNIISKYHEAWVTGVMDHVLILIKHELKKSLWFLGCINVPKVHCWIPQRILLMILRRIRDVFSHTWRTPRINIRAYLIFSGS